MLTETARKLKTAENRATERSTQPPLAANLGVPGGGPEGLKCTLILRSWQDLSFAYEERKEERREKLL